MFQISRARRALLPLAFLSLGACASTRGSAGGSSRAPSNAALRDAADDVLVRTIAVRRASGRSGLSRSVNLMSAAQLQAEQMAKTGTMAHALPGTAYPTLKSRLAAVSYPMRAAGENIAEGQRSAAEVMSSWMKSPGHRENILSSEFTEIGTGVAVGRNGRLYWAQVFGRPRSTSSRRIAD
ncbi:MAG: CAP domain-containing protein [Gemmatimonadaceae bacterium]